MNDADSEIWALQSGMRISQLLVASRNVVKEREISYIQTIAKTEPPPDELEIYEFVIRI